MASVLIWSVTMTLIVLLTGLVLLLFLYRKTGPPQKRGAVTGQGLRPEEKASSNGSTVPDSKNELESLLWPGIEKFDLKDCDSSADADSVLRADPGSSLAKPQRRAAHRAVHGGPFNLPHPRFHREIPINVGFPAGVHQISGFHGLFHLRLIYRNDAELRVDWKLTLKTNTNGHKMEAAACWLADGKDLHAESGLRCFREPRKHVSVGILQSSSDVLRSEKYLMRSSSCRFYLSLHRDYVPAPPARFMGTARRNSEDVAPPGPLIRTRDLPDAARLAEFLLSLDTDYKSFMSFFKWRQFYNARRRLPKEKEEFLCPSWCLKGRIPDLVSSRNNYSSYMRREQRVQFLSLFKLFMSVYVWCS